MSSNLMSIPDKFVGRGHVVVYTSRILAKFVFMIFHDYCVSGSSVFILLRSVALIRTSGGEEEGKKFRRSKERQGIFGGRSPEYF